MSIQRTFFSSAIFLLLSLLVATCSAIDEDLSDCGDDYELNYQLRLVTNMTTELNTVLHTETDVQLAQALRTHLSQIFTDRAHDVDLSFYDTRDDSLRLHHDQHVMDANQASYTLYLQRRQYMHLALANLQRAGTVTLQNDHSCHTSKLVQQQGDVVGSHHTGLFTARQPMTVLEGIDQVFNVRLYMANCAAALVLDTTHIQVKKIEVYLDRLANSFNVCDSTYVFDRQQAVVAAPVAIQLPAASRADQPDKVLCYCGVAFPSRDAALPGEQGIWQLRIYVTMPDGKITETTLHVRERLPAGNLKIIRAKVEEQGVVECSASEVGASVTLDWKPGSQYEPVI